MSTTSEEKKQETIAAIELVVREFLNPECVGKWFTVKERSLGNIMEQVNLNYHYSTYIYDELKEIGLIEKEGIRAQVRYRIITDVIPDSRAVAERIYRRKQDGARLYKRSGDDLMETRPGDLQPPRPKHYRTADDIERAACRKTAKVSKQMNRIPRLGEYVYALVEGYIVEARVIGVRFNEENKVLVSFETPIRQCDADGTNERLITKTDWCLRNISFSVDELVKKLTMNIKKFENKRR